MSSGESSRHARGGGRRSRVTCEGQNKSALSRPSTTSLLRCRVRRGDDPCVDVDRTGAAHALDLALFRFLAVDARRPAVAVGSVGRLDPCPTTPAPESATGQSANPCS